VVVLFLALADGARGSFEPRDVPLDSWRGRGRRSWRRKAGYTRAARKLGTVQAGLAMALRMALEMRVDFLWAHSVPGEPHVLGEAEEDGEEDGGARHKDDVEAHEAGDESVDAVALLHRAAQREAEDDCGDHRADVLVELEDDLGLRSAREGRRASGCG
jgi:hypothetical protein